MPEHPEVSAELSKKHRCIVITVVGGSHSATFRISEPVETLWAENSACPLWAQQGVRLWSKTLAGLELFQQLELLKRTTT